MGLKGEGVSLVCDGHSKDCEKVYSMGGEPVYEKWPEHLRGWAELHKWKCNKRGDLCPACQKET